MIPRTAHKKLTELAAKFPIVSVIGPRQSGKTTLVRAAFPNHAYLSLETPDIRAQAENDPRLFLTSAMDRGVILDEIQRVPELFSYLQTIVDEQKRPGQFILTGSQNFLLLEHVSQTLAGRVGFLQLLPLSAEELAHASLLPRSLYPFLFRGMYPPIYDRAIHPDDWYPNYIATYVERDVRLIKNIPDLSKFQTLLMLCAGRVGQVVNLSSLANDCGVSHNTVKSWLSILEASFILFLLRPYYKNFNKRVIKQPKLYFYDTGLLCSLLHIQTPEQLQQHYARGSIFESFAVSELLKYRLHRGQPPHTYFWRDHRGDEVDVIMEHGNQLMAIEIKSGHTPSPDYFHTLKKFHAIAPASAKHGAVIYAGDKSRPFADGTLISWRNIHDVFA